MTRSWGSLLLLALAACGRIGFDGRDARGDGVTSDSVGEDSLVVPVTCGDGVVDTGEQCDTAGASVGCTTACRLADQGGGGTCASPGVLTLVPSTSGMRAMATGDTSTATNGAQASCTAANSMDRTYSVVIPTATTLTVAVTPAGWNAALAVRDASLACNVSTTICCVDAVGAGLVETSPCSVPAGTMMVIVDSGGGVSAGPYTLTLSTP